MLTPLAVDASHPFPQLLNKSHNLFVRARRKSRRRTAPRHRAGSARLAAAHSDAARPGRRRTVGLHLSLFAASNITSPNFFPACFSTACTHFASRATAISISTRKKRKICCAASSRNCDGPVAATRFASKSKSDCPKDFRELLLEFFDLGEKDLYRLDGPLSMTHLAAAGQQ